MVGEPALERRLTMGRSPFRQPVQVDDLKGALRALRESGHRVTAARRMVLEALFEADGPASADHLARAMGGTADPLDSASVHRNLAQLEELGLVRHVHIGHGPGLYALVGGAEREYIACERCGRVTSVEPAKLDSVRKTIRTRFGYEARFSHFPILGLCRSCARAERGGAEEKGADEVNDEHEHSHEHPHSHRHSHGDTEHEHAHTRHEHEHTEHEHEHSHGDYVHSHPHVHEKGLEGEHDHSHED
ncbi:MAG TPA: transcriptional repressor [Solirubrobacterales bacterium]